MALSTDITTRGDITYVQFVGSIDEQCGGALTGLRSQLVTEQSVFNFRKVTRVNSIGASHWISFMASIGDDHTVTFEECSPSIVAQLNMVPSFGGHAEVLSVWAPYCCPNCDHQDQLLLTKGLNLPGAGERAPKLICSRCGEQMEFEGFDMKFFNFVHNKKPKVTPP